MESALTARRTVLDRKIETRDAARSDLKTRREEIAALAADIDMAIAKDRDDIARFLIKKEKPLSRHCAELARHVESLDREKDAATVTDEEVELELLRRKEGGKEGAVPMGLKTPGGARRRFCRGGCDEVVI